MHPAQVAEIHSDVQTDETLTLDVAQAPQVEGAGRVEVTAKRQLLTELGAETE